MQGSPISMRPSANTGPRGLLSPFSSRPQTAQSMRSPFSQGMRSPFLSRPKTAHQNMKEVASPLLSVAGALAMPDEEGDRTRSRPVRKLMTAMLSYDTSDRFLLPRSKEQF
jgi:hypothetical protein